MKNNLSKLSNSNGAVAIIVAIISAVLIAFAALAVDVGYLYMAKNEVQNAADAAALAGARQLGAVSLDGTLSDTDRSLVKKAAINTAHANKVAGVEVTISDADIVIKKWNSPALVNAVEVTAKMGGIATFFSPIFNLFGGTDKDKTVVAKATAALTPVSTGQPRIPVVIAENFFTDPITCDAPISMSGTGYTCGAWTTFTNPAPQGSAPQYVKDLVDGTKTIPETVANQDFWVKNGTLGLGYTALDTLFNQMKGLNDGIIDAETPEEDPLGQTWTTEVAVFNFPCGNANIQNVYKLVGYATIQITNVTTSGGGTVEAVVKCAILREGKGGGNSFSTFGTIPALVQ